MRTIIALLAFITLMNACSSGSKTSKMNPLLKKYDTPFNIAPFNEIKTEHYLPAFIDAIAVHESELKEIVANQEEPTFKNTVEALEYSGYLLNEVESVFDNVLSMNTNEELQAIAKEVAPILSAHNDNILLNQELYAKIKKVYSQKDELNLSLEQNKLLENTYKNFVRGGADLTDTDKETLRNINKDLSILTLSFGDNILAETNQYKLLIEKESDLAGLPQSSIDAAAEAATQDSMPGKWLFTIHKSSLIPFLQYSEKRELRENLFKAYINQGDNNTKFDNKSIISKIVSLRIQKANLLGYESHADFVLELNMAKKPQNVYDRLDLLWDPALKMAQNERNELQKMIDSEGGKFKLEAWDWWYYAEKLRKQKYDLDEEELRPYFEIENVKKGMFEVANKLFGIEFKKLENVPLPHEDAVAYEVVEANGDHIGILFQDFHPRASKQGGAWMSSYRDQYKTPDEQNTPPIITIVMNFSKPTADKPSLLTFEEVETMFHEFGHALHGLLSKCTYRSISGTAVSRDFVELPSQIMENWAGEPEVLKLYAKHYKTGEIIPDALIDKMINSGYFNQGFATTEYLAASYLDMDWHTQKNGSEFDANAFEKKSLDAIGLIPEIVVRYRSPYFRHIFSGGYSAGYYSYIWAEMLDADAFEAFKENGLFDKNTAEAFRRNILEKGGSQDEMKLYVAFRGKEPSMDPLLKRKGFIQ